MKKSDQLWLAAWYGKSRWIYLLWPLSILFSCLSFIRRRVLTRWFQHRLQVPVIIVGNISVGGTGKTPVIIALVKYLQSQGYKPGVVSRGYGGHAPEYPYLLDPQSTAALAGDEPYLIYQTTGCDLCVSPDRVAAAEKLVARGCSIILSDDGLQHYRLARSVEIVVVDGQRWFGNQQRLPVGPLRESVARLKSVDMVVVNQSQPNTQTELQKLGVTQFFPLEIQPAAWRSVSTNECLPLAALACDANCVAVAGIGNPQRFFFTLRKLGFTFSERVFPDHHAYAPEDFAELHHELVLMTEKDSVKCTAFAKPSWYALMVSAQLPDSFWLALHEKMKKI